MTPPNPNIDKFFGTLKNSFKNATNFAIFASVGAPAILSTFSRHYNVSKIARKVCDNCSMLRKDFSTSLRISFVTPMISGFSDTCFKYTKKPPTRFSRRPQHHIHQHPENLEPSIVPILIPKTNSVTGALRSSASNRFVRTGRVHSRTDLPRFYKDLTIAVALPIFAYTGALQFGEVCIRNTSQSSSLLYIPAVLPSPLLISREKSSKVSRQSVLPTANNPRTDRPEREM